MSERRFARVYFDDLIADHSDVWRDDSMLATWLRLLAASEKAWPSLAELPRSAKPRTVTRLIDAGMVTMAEDHHFRLRGFTSDRAKRQENARKAAGKRWADDAPAMQPHMQLHSASNASAVEAPDARKRTERDQKETSSAREPIDRICDIWMSVRYRIPTDRQRAFLYAYLQTFDETGEARAERLILSNPHDPIAAMKADLAEFRGERVKALEAEEQKPRPARKGSGLTGINAEIAAVLRDIESKRGDAA